MNKVVLIGFVSRDPEIRYSNGNNAIAKYTLAVNRRFKKEGEQDADFISCVAFGKQAEFVEKYVKKGTGLCIAGRIQTGSYTNKDGNKVYTTDVVVEEQEFKESKGSSQNATSENSSKSSDNGFMAIDGIDSELPFA